MKRLLLFGIVLTTLTSSAAFAEEKTVTLAIEKMNCALCPITVTKAIENVEGVNQVSVDYDNKRATVRYDEAITTWEKIAEASTNAGYQASNIK